MSLKVKVILATIHHNEDPTSAAHFDCSEADHHPGRKEIVCISEDKALTGTTVHKRTHKVKEMPQETKRKKKISPLYEKNRKPIKS